MSKLTAAVFKAGEGLLTMEELSGELDDFYKFLECSCFDIVVRKVHNTFFDVFCDDEGLLHDNPVLSAYDASFRYPLVGNLIFTHHNAEGETTGISQEDFDLLQKCLISLVDMRGNTTHKILWPIG